MSLSKENYNKLNENYLYSKEPREKKYHGDDVFWCRNWTFQVRKRDDGTAFMYDTYFDNWDCAIQVTDENINEFEFKFDFREVRHIRRDEADEYNKEDLYFAATNSGGHTCDSCTWVKKDAQRSKELLVRKKKEEIEGYKNRLKWAENDLERLLSQ